MIKGKVIHGDGIGKSQGYATANLDIGSDRTQLKSGVFAARTKCCDKWWDSALIVASDDKKVEVYLFGYEGGDFYGKYVEVEPVQKVSEIIPADSLEELQNKIEEDLRKIKVILQN